MPEHFVLDDGNGGTRYEQLRFYDAEGRVVGIASDDGTNSSLVERIYIGPELFMETEGEWSRRWWLTPELDRPIGLTIRCDDGDPSADCATIPAWLGIDPALAGPSTFATFALVQTFRNDVLGLVDEGGQLVETYSYNAHGLPTVSDPPVWDPGDGAVDPWASTYERCTARRAGDDATPYLETPCHSAFGNTLGWAGAHRSLSLGLYDLRNRQYDPAQALFLSPDPMGYVDSFDEWMFAGGDPVNGWDPFGLRAEQHSAALAGQRGQRIRLELRAFAPIEEFGFGFHGDDRGPSARFGVSSRMAVTLELTRQINAMTRLEYDGWGSGTWRVSDPDTVGDADIAVQVELERAYVNPYQYESYRYVVHVSGANSLISMSPDIDLRIELTVNWRVSERAWSRELDDPIQAHVSGVVRGNRFPAIDVVVSDGEGTRLVGHDGIGQGLRGPDMGPLVYLWGQARRTERLRFSELVTAEVVE